MSSNSISVEAKNNSGVSLFIGLNRADGPWLDGMNTSEQTWTATFNQSTCIAEIATGGAFSFDFPEYLTGAGCRMYISFENFTGVPDLTTATFVFDKVEMGWNAIWNQTSVDFFAIPLQLSVNGGEPVGYLSEKSGNPVSRGTIIDELLAAPAPYSTFRYPVDNQLGICRIFSPAMASSMTAPPWSYNLQNCLAGAISSGLPLLAQYAGTFNYGGFNMSGFAQIGTDGLSATCNSESITLSNINSATAFSNAITCVPNDAAGQKVAGIIGCALNRGVLYSPEKWGQSGQVNNGTPADYYKPSAANNQNQFNYYAKVLHANSIGGKCYAQSYDDFFNQAAAISVNGGDSVLITILPCWEAA